MESVAPLAMELSISNEVTFIKEPWRCKINVEDHNLHLMHLQKVLCRCRSNTKSSSNWIIKKEKTEYAVPRTWIRFKNKVFGICIHTCHSPWTQFIEIYDHGKGTGPLEAK